MKNEIHENRNSWKFMGRFSSFPTFFPLHLAPAIGGAVWFGVALGLSRKWLCGPRLAAGTAFFAAPK
jgi:hypothetical protein